VQDALHAQPGTLHHVTEASGQISLLGQSGQLSLAGFGDDASWTGYAMIAGHWYDGPGQVDVNTAFLTATGPRSDSSTRSPLAASTSRCRSPARSSIPRAGSRR
jgi:putative ABC transport system permease protein